MNIISEDKNQLARLDYSQLLKAILDSLKLNNPFKWSANGGDRLNLNIHDIADSLAKKDLSSPLITTYGIRSATINLTRDSETLFPLEIREIYQTLYSHLEASVPSQDIKQAISHLISNLADFKDNSGGKTKLGFKYNFKAASSLKQQRLNLQSSTKGSDAILKLHLLTITVRNISNFEQELHDGLENHISSDPSLSPSEQEELQDNLEDLIKNNNSDFYQLRDRVYQETVGKLKKEAKILYLEYLKDNIPNPKDDTIYLTDLIRRLRLLETYLNDSDKADGEYDVNYLGTKVNYKEQFARSEVLDILPIIPLIEGNLGETTQLDQGKKEFIFALKIKLNGQVNNQGEKSYSVLNYYLQLLDPESEEHKKRLNDSFKSDNFKRRVLRICLLYFFVFASRNNPDSPNYDYQLELDYDPVSNFETHCLPILRGNDEEEKRKLFSKIKEGFIKFKIEKKVARLKALIKGILEKGTIIPEKNWSIHLGIDKSLVEYPRDILDKAKFFRPLFNAQSKEYLRYLTIYPSQVEESSLCHLPVNLTIEDIRYFSTDESQYLSMNYDLKGIKTIPVVFWNFIDEEDNVYKIYNQYFKQEHLISITYKTEILLNNNSVKAFFYKFTFSLLVYISFKLIIDQIEEGERLFFPIMRLQKSSGDNATPDEEFMRNFSKTLSHLLSEKTLANSQGFNVEKFNPSGPDYQVNNTLVSLYSTLPKIFEFKNTQPQLDKLGMIIISSRESDRKEGEDQRLANLMGEVITLDLAENRVTLKNLKTFSENYERDQMYRSPAVIIEAVTDLYTRGYRDIFYIAKTPYSSVLNLTEKEEDDFFMSKSVISSLKGEREGLKIYPIFFDKYSVKKIKPVTQQPFYIKDTRQLNSLLNDPSKKTVIFFNLFNAITVASKTSDHFYNGVMSYSTLLNVYQGILEEQDIRDALIHDSQNNQLKTDLLNYLTLFHFARYESQVKPNIKLDPYENIIGDESVGKFSIFSHTDGKTPFNSLAFLTEVRRILNVKENLL